MPRSIVADPRSDSMKDVLNARIKHREPFRPFAPSILAERAADWYEQAYPSPFMVLVYKTAADKRARVPASSSNLPWWPVPGTRMKSSSAKYLGLSSR